MVDPRHAIDGRVVCDCADPDAARILDDARTTLLGQVWTGPTSKGLRRELNDGSAGFCGGYPLKLPLTRDDTPLVRALDVGPLQSRLYIEYTAACNISCFQACCPPETSIT